MQHRLWCNAEVQGQFAEHGSDEDSDEDSNDEGAGTAEPDAPRAPGMANARTAAAKSFGPLRCTAWLLASHASVIMMCTAKVLQMYVLGACYREC